MESSKIGLWTPARKGNVERVNPRRRDLDLTPQSIVLQGGLGKSFYLDGTGVIGKQFGFRDGPTATFDSVALEEIGIIKLKDLTAPTRGRATLSAKAADVHTIVLKADEFALVRLLRGFFYFRAAAFEEQNRFPLL
jgi:hypothetical protein